MKKRKILAISVGRSDYDRYYPILNELNSKSNINLFLFISKTHLDKKYGRTGLFIEKKFKILKGKYTNLDFKKTIEDSLCQDLSILIKKIKEINPDLIVILGDRYEMLIGPIAAIPKNIPLIHFYGGAVTEGAIDELIRHALTKMSHIHLVATEEYKKRLIQLGEEKWRIKNIGVHELKIFKKESNQKVSELIKRYNFDFSENYCLLTFHPVTLELNKLKNQLNNLFSSVIKSNTKVVLTYPNADPNNDIILNFFKKKFKNKKNYLIIKNCGLKNYASIMKNASYVIGNSSSGIVEAASLKVPAINIGTRQKGKIKPKNVIDSGYSIKEITKAINTAMSNKFKKNLKYIKNPYDSKVSASKIADFISKIKINDKLIRKKFINIL